MPLETADARSALGTDIALMGAAMANDGSFVGPAYRTGSFASIAYRYDVMERVFYLLVTPASLTHAEFRVGLPTPTGRTVSLVYTGAGLPRPRFDFSASTGAVTEVANSGTVQTRLWGHSRDESVWFSSFNDGTSESLQLTMPSATMPGLPTSYVLHYPIGAAAISPNGTRLYYYATDDHRVHALDLEHPRNVGPDFFPELPASGAIDPPGTGAQMLLTPDGGSLIIAGKDRLIVMPTP